MPDVAKLGKYTIPKDPTKGYSPPGPAIGMSSLKKEFEKALREYTTFAQSTYNATFDLDQYGVLSPQSIDDFAGKGNTHYKTYAAQYAAGVAITVKNLGNGKYVEGGKKYGDRSDKMISDLSERGLQLAENATTKTRTFMPLSLVIDPDAESVTYSEASESTSSTGGSGASVGQVAYFFANQFQTIQEDALSNALVGEKAILNDVPLWDTVIKAVNASLRSCASGPDGSFVAWYPDYWGLYGNATETLILEDIELIDLTITQSDDSFYSHVFVTGVDSMGSAIDTNLTAAVVSIENNASALLADAVGEPSTEVAAILQDLVFIPKEEKWKYSPKELYRRYGARSTNSTSMGSLDTLINASEGSSTGTSTTEVSGDPRYIMPILYALYIFMEHWSNQFSVSVQMTFMPELFPGCRVRLKSKDLSFYVKEVNHDINYSSGFKTSATCCCPIGSLVSGLVRPKTEE